MVKQLFHCVILTVCLTGACVRPTPMTDASELLRPVSTDPVVLIGTVVDEASNARIPSARMRLLRSGIRKATFSDSLGAFHFAIDSAGLWRVEAQAGGYITEMRELYVSCGHGGWTVEGWSPAACPVPPAPLIVRLRSLRQAASRDSMVRGRVLDEQTGKPLRAQVVLDSRTGTLSSDTTGEYVLRGRAPGVYVLEVKALGYDDERRMFMITCPDGRTGCRVGGARLNFWMRPQPYHQ